MRIVETNTRPARLALAVSHGASNRVLRRAFRLAGGRWGGRFDVLVRINANTGPDPFYAAVLRAADPDYVLALDPNLERFDWSRTLAALDIQPFSAERLYERAEYVNWYSTFVESPLAPDPDNREPVADYDTEALTWQDAAMHGLPGAQTERRRVAPRLATPLPVELSGAHLTPRLSMATWLLFGPPDDVDLAFRLWSLRALGARVFWLDPQRLTMERPPRLVMRAYLLGPSVPPADLQKAGERWTAHRHGGSYTAVDEVTDFGSRPAPYFASHLEAVEEHQGVVRTSLPAPAVSGRPLERALWGVAEYRLLSPNPGDPDGLVLARGPSSRRLIAPEGEEPYWRVTRRGFAEARGIHGPDLVTLPSVRYQDALAAALGDGGYSVEASDKGRYQQRSLQLGRGLRFLAWCLRQRESARLLKLFDGRRPVRYDELRDELHAALRESRSRLRAPLMEQANAWLADWTDALLDRGLLVGGFVLRCRECARTAFYRTEQIGQRFTCERCAHESLVPGSAQRALQLNEAFFQLRQHNGDVVTLLLAELRGRAEDSFLYQPEVVLRTPAGAREVDAIALVEGGLALAEAKSGNSLKADEVSWYAQVARDTRAREVLFATTSRNRPLCAELDCETCAQQGGEHHRDYAWSDSARKRVHNARQQLAANGTGVRTLCYQSLVASHPDFTEELRPFTR